MDAYTYTQPTPCTKMWEHHPHPIMISPLYNLGQTKIIGCPGFKIEAYKAESTKEQTDE
jgi:hypothetical protein